MRDRDAGLFGVPGGRTCRAHFKVDRPWRGAYNKRQKRLVRFHSVKINSFA